VAGKTPNYEEFETGRRDRLRRQMQAIRLGDFIGVRYNITDHTNDFEIYNIVTDPKQTHNVAVSQASLQRQMKDRVLQVRRPDGDAKRPYDNELVPSVKAGNLVSNRLDYAVYQGGWPWVPNFEALVPAKRGRATGLDLGVGPGAGAYGIRFSGYLNAPRDGEYTFHLVSDAGAQLRLHDALVIDDDFSHDGSEVTASIRLKSGLHPLRLFYRHQTGAPVLRLDYSGPGIERQSVPTAFFSTGSEVKK
jgi:hypothetical protein